MLAAARFAVSPFALTLVLAQQEPASPSAPLPAPPKHSLADGLVRQLVETDALRLPRCDTGLEMAAGEGPLAMIVRRADGSLQIRAIERGLGEHGATPEKVRLDPPEEQEEVVGAPKPKKKKAAPPPLATLRIRLVEKLLELGPAAAPGQLRAAVVEREAVRPMLVALFASTKDTSVAGNLLIEAQPEVPVQDVMTLLEVARAVGFQGVMFDGSAARRQLATEQQEQVLDLPAELGWKKTRGVCDGEVLLLVDGPARWGDVAPLYMLFARAGIWRISFVGQQDANTRWKLPANLPVDRGS